MRKFISKITFLYVVCFSALALAQTITIEGTVIDKLGETLPGVNVIEKGTLNGIVTNLEGQYKIEVPESATLIISFIGMESKEIPVKGQNIINVTLGQDAELMDEVMVVAYGTSTKEAFTGAATVIDKKVMEKRPIATLDQALQGAAANVLVSNSSGQPGASASIRIRGVGSMSASSEPLYVVDGIPMSNSITNLNPKDIASMTILKDAAATALYGSRAANGVVVITTKSGGNSGETIINFSTKGGISTRISDGYDLMNAEQYYQHTWQGLYNQAIYAGQSHSDAVQTAHNDIKTVTGFNPYSIDQPFKDEGTLSPNAVLLYDTDWRDAIYRTGITQDYALSASGGDENGSFFISLGAYDEEGIVIGTDYRRYTMKANLDRQIKPWLKVGAKNSFSYSDSNAQPGGTEASNPVRSAELINPVSPIYNDDGSYNWDNLTALDFNPIGLTEMDIYNALGYAVNSSIYADFTLPFDLKFKTTLALDYAVATSTQYYNAEHGNGAAVGGRSSVSRNDNLGMNVSNVLSWNRTIEDNSWSVLVGQESHFEDYTSLYGEVTNILVPGNPSLSGGSVPMAPASGSSDWRMLSYFGQVNYNYQGKYYLSGSARTDGSSRFGENNRWGAFYSIGSSWRISEEDFFDVDWMDNLKLRSSFGTTGNSNIDDYAWRGLYGSGANYGSEPGIYPIQQENPDLTWETSATYNLALEASIFQRISMTAEFYHRYSDGLLYDQPVPPSNGYTSITTNLGAMSNTGFEFSLNSINMKRGNFEWITNFNISTNKNEVQSLTQEQIVSGTKLIEEGSDFYQYYMREWAGVDPMTGLPMWYTNLESDDITNNTEPSSAYHDPLGTGRQVTNEYSDAERIRTGSALPTVFGSLGNNFRYKGFGLDVTFYYSFGNQIYNSDYASNMHDGTNAANNLAVDAGNAWTTPGQITDVPVYVANNTHQGSSMSTRYLEDGDFIRLQNITFSYSLPDRLLTNSAFGSAQFYISGENLWTWTKYKGFDPEVGLSGVSSGSIPGTKNIVFGVNVSF